MSEGAPATAGTQIGSLVRLLGVGAVAVGLLFTVVFMFIPELDLLVSSFYFRSDGTFAAAHRGSDAQHLRHALIWFLYACTGLCLAGLLATRISRRTWLSLRFSQWLFLALSLGVGPGLVANVVLKDHWGRARPKQLVEFGGIRAFSGPLVPSDQCARNCSFVSGEASSLFMLFYAAALVVPQVSGVLIVAGTLGGLAAGAIRIAQGAHFLSDVVFAGVLMALTAVILHELLFGMLSARVLDGE